jgi:hypothetical protein
MDLPELPWALPVAYQTDLVLRHLSFDGQIYRRCGNCGWESRLIHEFVTQSLEGILCERCDEQQSRFVRHLEHRRYQCAECDYRFDVQTTGFEEIRCPECALSDLTLLESAIVPPFPGRFGQDVVAKAQPWGISGAEDSQFVLQELQGLGFLPDFDRYLLVSLRFCRRLRLHGGYEQTRDRAHVRNVEANLYRDYFRRTGQPPAGLEALRQFEAGVRVASDPVEQALEEHNVAMAVYSMLARYSEADVVGWSGRPKIRAEAVAAARNALEVFEHGPSAGDPSFQVQTARIYHVIGDLLRVGNASDTELRRSVEALDRALEIRKLPRDLRSNIRASRKAASEELRRTTAALSDAEPAARSGLTGYLSAVARSAAHKLGRGAKQPIDTQPADPAPEMADATFRNPDDLDFVVIPLETDAESLAEELIRDSLPKTFLDEIDISDDQGKGRLFALLMRRRHQASLEKDEILRFVERNEHVLRDGGAELLRLLSDVFAQVDGGDDVGWFFQYFLEQVNAAIEGRPEDINVKSDRLLWLVYALSLKVSSGDLTYDDARATLLKEEHRARISPLSLQFMLQDYAETIGGTNESPIEYVMLVVECGILSANESAVAAGAGILSQMTDLPKDIEALLDMLVRARAFLAQRNRDTANIDDFIGRIRSRFDEMTDDEF